MERLYVAAAGATLRSEDRRKAVEVAAMLAEIARVVARTSRQRPFVLLDAASGNGYVGLLAAKLALEPAGRPEARVITLEREPARVARAAEVLVALDTPVGVDVRQADVGAAGEAWPPGVQLVTALHACGPAADAIIDTAISRGAETLLLVPCCTGEGVYAAAAAAARAAELGIPRQAGVRRRFVQAFVDAERTLRLEAAGWQTEVVELCPPTVTPHNLLWRARRVGEPNRMSHATADRQRLLTMQNV